MRCARRLSLIALFAVAACGASSREVAPLANAAPVTAARTPCDVTWIERAETMRISERTDGHEGWFELEITLRRAGDAFTGTAKASYRRHEQAPPTRSVHEVRVPSSRIEAVLAVMRASFEHPPDPADAERTRVHESWHTVRLALELSGSGRARFTGQGHERPQPWQLDGCNRELPHAGRAQFGKAYGELEQLIDRQSLFDVLEKQTAP